ncbi:pectate lyase family protein [Pseudoduganella sp. R-34]|uniref:pectate lyase family protein n=1 Tax=unclassified Pseudoduganella TaxID=2637179 RepID=UPI003CEE3362
MKKSFICGALMLIYSAGSFAADWPSGYSKCADQGGTCKVGTSSRQVSYGIKDKWVVKTLAGDILCATSTFGSDPSPGVTKKCAVGPLSSTTPTPTPTPTPDPTPAPAPAANATKEAAPSTGWAGQGGGTTGGAAAPASAIYLVNTGSQLVAALKAQGNNPKIIKLQGTINMAAADNGGPFTSATDEGLRLQIKPGSNTTLIGVGNDARLVNGNIVLNGVQNVIVRNLTIQNPCSLYPVWDPNDGSSGNWNSEYDGITISNSRNVWVDHNVFTDGSITDDKLPVENGKVKQCHDGALDVKNGSDYVTVSNNRFELHQKNNLIGSSDSKTTDDGHLTVTFHNNHFLNVAERGPRVRFGKVHLYNNYFEGSRSHAVYPNHYSIGVAYKAKIISQNNAFDIAGASSCPQVVTNPGSSSKTGAITDAGSLLNGAALNLSTKCSFSNQVGWSVPYSVSPLAASAVKASVLSNAGTGKITVN